MQESVTIEEARELAGRAGKECRVQRRRKAKEEADARRARFRTATEPIEVKLPFPPSVNQYWRTAVVGNRCQTYISKKGKLYRQAVIAQWQHVGLTYKGRLALRMDVVWPDRRERDLDNFVKAVQDSLEHAGAYENDRQIKLLVVDEKAVEAPGWIRITLGAKPSEVQLTLFETDW